MNFKPKFFAEIIQKQIKIIHWLQMNSDRKNMYFFLPAGKLFFPCTAALIIVFLFSNNMAAQDVIHVKNKKESIQAKIIEIGTGEIKYKLWEEKEDGLV